MQNGIVSALKMMMTSLLNVRSRKSEWIVPETFNISIAVCSLGLDQSMGGMR